MALGNETSVCSGFIGNDELDSFQWKTRHVCVNDMFRLSGLHIAAECTE